MAGDFLNTAGKSSPKIGKEKDISFQCRKNRRLVENAPETLVDTSRIRTDYIIRDSPDQADPSSRSHFRSFINPSKVFFKFYASRIHGIAGNYLKNDVSMKNVLFDLGHMRFHMNVPDHTDILRMGKLSFRFS